ncbi:MAG: ATP synthase subunit I [Desulfomonilia bacterium]
MTLDVTVFLAFLAGIALGGFYFLSLWWTVKRLPDSERPALLTVQSYIVRLGVVLPCFYLVMWGRWERMAGCMAGFIISRLILTRWIRNAPRGSEVSIWKS